MRKNIIALLVCLVIAQAISMAPSIQSKVDSCMGVKFNFSFDQYVSYGNVFNGLTNKSIIAWVKPTSFTAGFFHGIAGKSSTPTSGFAVGIDPATGFVWVHEQFATNPGDWRTSTAIAAGGALSMIGVTYTGTFTAPIIYQQGVSVPVTTVNSPAGALSGDSSKPWVIGTYVPGSVSTKSLNGDILAVNLYNVVLTPEEMAEAYSSRLVTAIRRGLISGPDLCGAKDLSVFDAATLASTNTLPDGISGFTGTPTGSPLGAANASLNLGR